MCDSRTFVYGKAVGGDNFTDRVEETKRLKMNFEAGINSIIISPRRIGKTSLVKHVIEQVDENVKVVFMDIYRCRTEYDFYDVFASSIISACSTKTEQALALAKEMILSINPKVTLGWGGDKTVTLSLGINKKSNSPEEILSLPERISQKIGKRIVVCIDEFQQIGEMPDSLDIQKRLRTVWQHQQNVSYCFFGSKRHLMMNIFQSRSMPFYHFGEMLFIERIPAEEWVPFIQERFVSGGKAISAAYALKICEAVENYSAYVQQLAWNVYASTDSDVDEKAFVNGLEATKAQTSPLFVEQTIGLTTYQMNFLRAICSGIHKDFSSSDVTDMFPLGTRNNITRIIHSLTERELIELKTDGTYDIPDPMFKLWIRENI